MISNLASMLQLVVLLFPWSDGTIIRDVLITSPGDNSVVRCESEGLYAEFQICFNPVGSADLIIIYSKSLDGFNPDCAQLYAVSWKFEIYELTILNASSIHVGTYFCDYGYVSQKTDLVLLDGSISSDVTAVLPGDNTEFSCVNSVFDFPVWQFQMHFKPVGSSDYIILYKESSEWFNPVFAQRYNFTKYSDSYYAITVLNASSSHVGTYICAWGSRLQMAELILLEPPGLKCESTERIDEKEVRYDCEVGFHGNVPPALEMWMLNENKFVPILTLAEKDHNTSKITSIQNISSACSDSHFACRLPNINIESSNFRSNCIFKRSGQSCKKIDSKQNDFTIFGVSVAGAAVPLFIIAIIVCLIVKSCPCQLPKQLRSSLASDNNKKNIETDTKYHETKDSAAYSHDEVVKSPI